MEAKEDLVLQSAPLTPREALSKVNNMTLSYAILEKAVDRLEELEDKATPKKVSTIIIRTWTNPYSGKLCHDYADCCPICGECLRMHGDDTEGYPLEFEVNYCPECGQKLEW